MTTTVIRVTATALHPQLWQVRGLCRGVDPEIFFPEGTSGPAARRVRAAKRICYDCPVISECRTWALRRGEDWGVWGGLSEHERRVVLAQRSTRIMRTGP